MDKKYVSNDIAVDLDDSEMVRDNGLSGDAKRSIWMERSTAVVWIETNGDPVLYETLAEAEAAL